MLSQLKLGNGYYGSFTVQLRCFILKVWWQLPLFLFILSFTVTYIHNNIRKIGTLIHLHLPRDLSVCFIAFAQREKPPWGAEPRFERGPAVQQANTLLIELCCTLMMFHFRSGHSDSAFNVQRRSISLKLMIAKYRVLPKRIDWFIQE